MTQRHRSLSCFLTVALLVTCSTAAMARTSHKVQPAKNAHEKPYAKLQAASGERPYREARHAKHGAKRLATAHRKSTKSSDASDKNAPETESAPPLSGDLALVKDAITRYAATAFAPRGVTVNAIAPAAIDGPAAAAMPSDTVAEYVKGIPLGRLGRPEEIAALAVFLASPDAGFTTGATYDVNGGIVMR